MASSPGADDASLGPARFVAAGAGCFWLLLGSALATMAVLAAAITVPAFVILGPWAVAALALAALLFVRAPSRRTRDALSDHVGNRSGRAGGVEHYEVKLAHARRIDHPRPGLARVRRVRAVRVVRGLPGRHRRVHREFGGSGGLFRPGPPPDPAAYAPDPGGSPGLTRRPEGASLPGSPGPGGAAAPPPLSHRPCVSVSRT